MEQEYVLELDGKLAGRFFGFTGGSVETEVILEQTGGGVIRTHTGSPKYQDVEMRCGTGMSSKFYNWLGSMFIGNAERKSGAISKFDAAQKELFRLEFNEALVASVTLPKLEKGSKANAYLTVRFSPESTEVGAGGGTKDLGVYVGRLPKAWNIGNFRLKIDGVERDSSHVTEIDTASTNQKIADDVHGRGRIPVALALPSIRLSLPKRNADGFLKWQEEYTFDGKVLSFGERNGSIEFLAPSSSSAYFTVKLLSLQIQSIDFGRHGNLNISLSPDSIQFSAGPAAIK